MSRCEYLEALEKALRPLVSRREREDILRYYTEYFDEAGEGQEAWVIEQLGDPAALAELSAGQSASYPLPEPELPDPEDPAEQENARTRRQWLRLWLVAAAVCLTVMALLWWYDSPVGKVYTGDTVLEDLEFSSIRLDMACADVQLQKGPAYKVELLWNEDIDYEVRCGVRGGCLYITGDAPTVPVAKSVFACQVNITIPEGAKLKSVGLGLLVGDAVLGHLAGSEIDQLTVSTGNGRVSLLRANVVERVDIYSGRGDVSYHGEPAADTTVKAAAGDVQLLLSCAKEQLSYELNAAHGNVLVNDFSEGSACSAAAEDPLFKLTAEASKGSIRLMVSTSY